MARKGISEERQRAAAIQGTLRQLAHGERPMYRLRMVQDGQWSVVGAEWLSGSSSSRREALAAARAGLAATLEVEPDRFDVEAG